MLEVAADRQCTVHRNDLVRMLERVGGLRIVGTQAHQLGCGGQLCALEIDGDRLRRGGGIHQLEIEALLRCIDRDGVEELRASTLDRKSTRLNSSHANISYAVFCL